LAKFFRLCFLCLLLFKFFPIREIREIRGSSPLVAPLPRCGPGDDGGVEEDVRAKKGIFAKRTQNETVVIY
jgi:hypothetical protein